MPNDHFRGHRIAETPSGWIYRDTGERVADTWQQRPCGHCGLPYTPEGHDGCLGEIAGVVNACCGHGREREAYVQLADGSELRGRAALRWLARRAISA